MSDEPASYASSDDSLQRVRAMIQFTPQAKALGMEVTRIEPARVWGLVPYREDLIGDPATGVIAGGVITTFLDTLCGTAAVAAMEHPTTVATIDLRIDYMRAATPQRPVLAEAQPVMRDEDIGELIRHAVFLQRVALPQITFALLTPDEPIHVECDGRLVSQALTNVLKNAGEAVRAKFGKEGDEEQPLAEGGRIEIRLVQDAARVGIEVIDNGVGLPKEDRNRLTEPYVTKRVKGTGLGLAIVKKIMEDHKGALALEDAPKTDDTGTTRESGALVRLTFPRRLAAPVKLAGE
jgi:uncharacterized protein (TIGR00369 family)